MMDVLGIDFGTTNCVVSHLGPDGEVTTRQFTQQDAAQDVFRTVLCFWLQETQGRSVARHAAGAAAIDEYLQDPLSSRLIMSIKTFLGQRSFTQTRIFNTIFSLEQLIALLLGELAKACAIQPAQCRAIVGRPVKFAGELADDDLGVARLRAAFALAGFADVQLVLEPQAAGYRFAQGLRAPATVLIGDFGGGTSDFSVIRFTPNAGQGQAEQLAHAGIGIGGDTFDYRIIDQLIAPHLGKGSTYKVLGTSLPVPPEYYSAFARWHRISQMRAPRTMRDIAEVARAAEHKKKLEHLISLVRDEQGYRLYQSVAQLKADLSSSDTARFQFQHQDFTLDTTVTRAAFETWISADLARLSQTVDTVMASSGLSFPDIDRVFLTGGTSLVPAVREIFAQRFGEEKISGGKEFVSVSEGLALIGQDILASKK